MARVWSAAISGVAGVPVEVEVRISSQLPRVDVVGLPEAAVRESISRIRGAIATTGLSFPDRRVTVNLAPAELRKNGTGLDLPIAIGILSAAGLIEPDALTRRGFFGELALDGRLRITRGTLAAALALQGTGTTEAIVSAASARSAVELPHLQLLGAQDLCEVVAHLKNESVLLARRDETGCPDDLANPRPNANPPDGTEIEPANCLSDVRGQPFAKRALEVAAAGGHGLLLTGPPGTGKTLLAKRLPGLLPVLEPQQTLETLCIRDAAGILDPSRANPATPPFRAPHHTASAAGLLGGGNPIRAGEVSLAHHGVLFLDELPEFDRRCLESLREILESGVVRIARAETRCELPARFQLVAAANPCPCGYFGTVDRDCRCDDAALDRYRRRLSGPLLDRIDLSVRVGEVPWATLSAPSDGESSQVVRARVEQARARQRDRGVLSNAAIADAHLDALVCATEPAQKLLGQAVDRLRLSARGARRVLRVARTIADLSHADEVGRAAMAEALQLRL